MENTRSLTVRGCKHDRKGYCSTHEMVATKKWRDIPCLKAGPGGRSVKTTRKKHYFEFEVGPRGRGVLRQTLARRLLHICLSGVQKHFHTVSGSQAKSKSKWDI